ncbi:MAG: hypothetical protein V1904_08950 [Bacteroidota bacterium]
MMKEKQKIQSVADILPKVLEEITRSNTHEQIQLEKIWKDILVSMQGFSGVKLNGFKDGIVFIVVDSAARLYYWKSRQGMVLKRFQERRTDVTNIVFKIGKVT